MFPVLFKIGSFSVDMYGVMVGLGLIASIFVFRFMCSKKSIAAEVCNFYSILAVASIVAGFVFAILFQSVYDYFKYGKFDLNSGMTFMGGLIGGVIAFVAGALLFGKEQEKANFFKVCNYAALSITAAHALGRIGCFCAGCCYGIETEGWGVVFYGHKHKRIPTQLYEALFLSALFAVLFVMSFNYKKDNYLLITYLYAYAVFRFIIEFWRGDDRGAMLKITDTFYLSPSQIQSLIMLAAAIALTVLLYKTGKIFVKIPSEKTQSDE